MSRNEIDMIKFTFEDDPDKTADTILATLPCGCSAALMSKSSAGVNQFNNPIQFTSYCDPHYPW